MKLSLALAILALASPLLAIPLSKPTTSIPIPTISANPSDNDPLASNTIASPSLEKRKGGGGAHGSAHGSTKGSPVIVTNGNKGGTKSAAIKSIDTSKIGSRLLAMGLGMTAVIVTQL